VVVVVDDDDNRRLAVVVVATLAAGETGTDRMVAVPIGCEEVRAAPRAPLRAPTNIGNLCTPPTCVALTTPHNKMTTTATPGTMRTGRCPATLESVRTRSYRRRLVRR
jgi:hypothetical protein